MVRIRQHMIVGIVLGVLFSIPGCGRGPKTGKVAKVQPVIASGAWNFAVSGDSRNCGNVVMPAIAAGAKKDAATFYWHLGDLRAIYTVDEDYLHEPEHRGQPVDQVQYQKDAWDDFAANQIAAFDPLPFYLGIGNHETIPPKTRAEFEARFANWLNAPGLRKQRLADDPADTKPRTYYHWIQGGVDFIYADNATHDQFDAAQLAWIEKTLQNAAASPEVHSVVFGMHVALPESLSRDHSMSDWETGTATGSQVYADLLDFQHKSGKPLYVLASHSHFLMTDLYESDYWRQHGGVLRGWIVGTAGAVRYALPPEHARSKDARTKVYGYLMGTVQTGGAIEFTFHEVKRQDIPDTVAQRYTPEFVDWCFANNADPKIP